MSQQYDNTNSGALFRNDKAGNDKRPDYKGSIDCEGRSYWISAWIRDKKDGSGKFMSLKLEPKEQPPAPAPRPTNHQQAKANAYVEDDMDKIPF